MNSLENRIINDLAKSYVLKCQSASASTQYANQARKSGYEYLNRLLLGLSSSSQQHAEILFEALNNILSNGDDEAKTVSTNVNINIQIDSTYENISSLVKQKKNNLRDFQDYINDARDAENSDVSRLFTKLATVELTELERLEKALIALENNTMFTNEVAISWLCLKCNYVHKSVQAPEICPLCKSARANFVATNELI